MPLRFFFSHNSNRRICGQAFEPLEVFAGTIRGVFATEDDALSEQIAKEPGVEEINASAYEEKIKKKVSGLQDLKHSNQTIPREKLLVALKGNGAAVVEYQPKPATQQVAADILAPVPIDDVVPPRKRK